MAFGGRYRKFSSARNLTGYLSILQISSESRYKMQSMHAVLVACATEICDSKLPKRVVLRKNIMNM